MNEGPPDFKSSTLSHSARCLQGECGSIFCLAFTVLPTTLMSIEHGLDDLSSHRRRRGYSIMIILLLIPISTNVFRILENESREYKNDRRFAITEPSFTCYRTTSFAYLKFTVSFVVTNSESKEHLTTLVDGQ